MIDEPIRFIDDFVKAGSDLITVHAEACKHLHRTIYAIKEKGVKVGVSLNPASSCSMIENVINDIDMVLIMTVNPGFGGQSFIENSINKIKEVKELIKKNNATCDIQVDGGITLENVDKVIEAGANIIVAGSSVYGATDVKERIGEFKKIFAKYE
jgi:ribulose-phosphate 3-epimerase